MLSPSSTKSHMQSEKARKSFLQLTAAILLCAFIRIGRYLKLYHVRWKRSDEKKPEKNPRPPPSLIIHGQTEKKFNRIFRRWCWFQNFTFTVAGHNQVPLILFECKYKSFFRGEKYVIDVRNFVHRPPKAVGCWRSWSPSKKKLLLFELDQISTLDSKVESSFIPGFKIWHFIQINLRIQLSCALFEGYFYIDEIHTVLYNICIEVYLVWSPREEGTRCKNVILSSPSKEKGISFSSSGGFGSRSNLTHSSVIDFMQHTFE